MFKISTMRIIAILAALAACAASLAAQNYVRSEVTTNGVLVGYVVQNKGETVCTDPTVWKNFRDGVSYIVCD